MKAKERLETSQETSSEQLELPRSGETIIWVLLVMAFDLAIMAKVDRSWQLKILLQTLGSPIN